MSFDLQGRTSGAWKDWDLFSRHAEQETRTLGESRIARPSQSRVLGISQSAWGAICTRAFSAVDWDAVLLAGVMLACFMGGVAAAGFVLLQGVGR